MLICKMKVVIQHEGADLNIKDDYGFTVLILASQEGNYEIVEILERAGATE